MFCLLRFNLTKSELITIVINISADYGRMQELCKDFFVGRKIDPDDLVGAHEIAERMGLSFPNVVHTWRKRHKDFPEPVAQLHAGLIWDWHEIKTWLETTNRTQK